MTAVSGKDPLSGLGYDGPLAAFSKVRRNLADYFQERVAVVTNPSIDRVREGDHFSVRVFLGRRPSLKPGVSVPHSQQIELHSPLLLGGSVGDRQECRRPSRDCKGVQHLSHRGPLLRVQREPHVCR